MVDGETNGLIRQEKAHDEGKSESDDNAGVSAPETEVIGGDRKDLPSIFHSFRNLLPAKMTKKSPQIVVSSSINTAALNVP